MPTLNILPKNSSRNATEMRNRSLPCSRSSQNLFISNEVRGRRGASHGRGPWHLGVRETLIGACPTDSPPESLQPKRHFLCCVVYSSSVFP